MAEAAAKTKIAPIAVIATTAKFMKAFVNAAAAGIAAAAAAAATTTTPASSAIAAAATKNDSICSNSNCFELTVLTARF